MGIDDLERFAEEHGHENCVNVDDVLDFATSQFPDEIRAHVKNDQAHEWLKGSKPFLDVLNRVSKHDKDQLRDVIKFGTRAKDNSSSDSIPEALKFSVATDVSEYLESLAPNSPGPTGGILPSLGGYWVQRKPDAASYLLGCLESCALGDDLEWASELIGITRLFRDFLFAISEPQAPFFYAMNLKTFLDLLNTILQSASNYRLVFWKTSDKEINFGRAPNIAANSITICLTNWFTQYLTDYYPLTSLGVCVECGIFFSRQRKDNVYCSKTCQNRVAYKRKKIFETGVLREVHVDPDTTTEISSGLLFHHSRLGLGVVETVDYEANQPLTDFEQGTTELFKARHLARRAKSIRMRVRFLHGIRTLKFKEIFGTQKEESSHHFYFVTQPEVVAGLF